MSPNDPNQGQYPPQGNTFPVPGNTAPGQYPSPSTSMPPMPQAPPLPVQPVAPGTSGSAPMPPAMQQPVAPMPVPPQPVPPQTAQPPASQPIQPVSATIPNPQATTQPVLLQPHTNPNSTQNALQIAEIRDGVVIMNDGSFRSVLMLKSINFDLMSQSEQEAVEHAYQNFLNSLYFSMQIFVRSQKVDLRPYIEKLDKIRTEHDNMLLALLMDDYINYIDALSQQTNIMDKKFYIVIPYSQQLDEKQALGQSKNFISGLAGLFSKKEQHITINEEDLEKAKNELRNRVQAVLSGLLGCGVQGIPLDTQELIELYYDTYNPDTATRQELKNFDSLSADIITKGEGLATQPHLQRELQ